jgi:predicted permease
LPANNFLVLARLKSGIGIRQAQADVDTVAAGIRQQYAKYFRDETIRVVSLQAELVRNVRPMMWVMLGGAGCLLLIGCANVGNLFLARAVSRQGELAIRAALGARPFALIRQMLTETLSLAAAGGILGSLLADWAHHALPRFVASSIYVPRLGSVTHDLRLLALSAAVLVVVAAALSVLPCLRLCRPNLDEALKPAGRKARVARSVRLGPDSLLLTSQVCLGLALLVGTVLLWKSLEKLLETNRGFQPDRLLAVDVGFSNAAFRLSPNFRETEPALYHQFEEHIKSLPGVRSVAAVDRFPLEIGGDLRFKADGTGPISENFEPAELHLVTPSFFEIMNLKLTRGRWLAETDTLSSPPVAVINRAMAGRYWPGSDPVGRTLWPMFQLTSQTIGYIVVGVVQEPRRFGAGGNPEPAVYQAFDQVPPPYFSVVIRTAADPHADASMVRTAALQMLPGQTVVGKTRTGVDIVSASSARLRTTSVLLSLLTFLALILAALGVYALVSYHTSQRRREIGIRMALGATRADVLLLVFTEGIVSVTLGILLGWVLSLSLAHALRSLLYEAPPIDFWAFAAATLFFVVVALLAMYVPANREAKVDPMAVLRYE